jgi:LPXTG-site transpeptidase (sortase) family protein
MADRKSSAGCASSLFVLAGLILLIAGGIAAYPALQSADAPTPIGYGEAAPPLRPTVTPLPIEGSAPLVLPNESPVKTPTHRPQARSATPVEQSGDLPTRIVIPSIDLDAPIETMSWSTVDGVSMWDLPDHFAAGWLKTSARLGAGGNTVLDGHHNIAGKVFQHLVDLKAGATIEVEANNQVYFYRVTTLRILPERGQPLELRLQNAQWIQPTTDERLTLVTCWPYNDNSHRLIIVARPIDPNRIKGNLEQP